MPPKNRKWPFIVALLVVLALAGAGAGIYFGFFANRVVVPDVTSKTQMDAEDAIVAAELQVGFVNQVASESVEPGCIVTQEPKAGEKAKKGSQVKLSISTGPEDAEKTVVPDLTGKTAEDAEAAITAAGLVPQAGNPVFDDKAPADQVAKQSPAATTQIAEGSTVYYKISKGPQDPKAAASSNDSEVDDNSPAPEGKAKVPNVVGMSEKDAKAAIEGAGLKINVTYLVSANGTDKVTTQDPKKSTVVEPGSTVNVTIDKKQG